MNGVAGPESSNGLELSTPATPFAKLRACHPTLMCYSNRISRDAPLEFGIIRR